jgi:hypothetical protein
MIRHASFNLAAPIPPLTIAMIEPSFGALLVTAIGAASLTHPRMLSANGATVALAAITVGAQKELGTALAVSTNPPLEAIFRRRHARC